MVQVQFLLPPAPFFKYTERQVAKIISVLGQKVATMPDFALADYLHHVRYAIKASLIQDKYVRVLNDAGEEIYVGFLADFADIGIEVEELVPEELTVEPLEAII